MLCALIVWMRKHIWPVRPQYMPGNSGNPLNVGDALNRDTLPTVYGLSRDPQFRGKPNSTPRSFQRLAQPLVADFLLSHVMKINE